MADLADMGVTTRLLTFPCTDRAVDIRGHRPLLVVVLL
jgi:hypothetical protein